VLSLSGNSEQAFAALNSIQANPLTWMEWNYNEFIKPYVVYSSSVNPLNSASYLTDPANWESMNGGGIRVYDQKGYVRETDTNAQTLVFVTADSYNDSFSSSISIPSSGYYKMVFMVKADVANVYGTANKIDTLTVSPNATTGTLSTYYYRVVPRSKDYYQPYFDPTGADEVGVSINQASATLRWNSSDTSVKFYDIYRRVSGEDTSKYIKTIQADAQARTINVDSAMTHFDNSDNWKISASVGYSSAAPTNPYKILKRSTGGGKLTSGFTVNNKTKGAVGAVALDFKRNLTSGVSYTASATNVTMNLFKKYDDGGDSTRFDMQSDLSLTPGQQYTFTATVKNPLNTFTALGGGSVTVSVLIYNDALGTSLNSTIQQSVAASAIANTWTTIPVTFTAIAGKFVSFRIVNSETYNLGTIPKVKKGNSPYPIYPLAVDAVGLWAGASAPTWTYPDTSNIFIKIQTDSFENYRYVDDTTTDPQSISADEFSSTDFYISPIIRLYNGAGANYLESTKFFSRIIDPETNMPSRVSNSFKVDGTKYMMVEVFFGSDDAYDTMEIDLNMTAPSQSARMLMNKPEVVKIDKWNFSYWDYSPIESPFYSNRPGEALLHPYLSSSDKKITIPKTDKTIWKQPTNIFYAANYAMNVGYPYRQTYFARDSRFKYYLSPDDPSITPTVIRAQYSNFLDINKIVVKSSNILVDMTTTSGSVVVLGPSNSTLATIPWTSGDFNNNGIMVIYYDGASWSTSRGSWVPPQLTDSGVLQNVTSSVTGLIFINNASLSSSSANQNVCANNSKTPEVRTPVIEISPRLEIDISNLISAFVTDKNIDNADSVAGFPIGYMNANTGSLDISNIPVYRNSFPHTLFDNISENATFSDLLRQNVKFTVGLISPSLDFTDYVPFMTMYSESWNISGVDKVTVNLFDTAKARLMGAEAPDYLAWGEGLFETIANLLEVSGIGDYDIDGLRDIVYNKSRSTSYFWAEKKDNIFDVLKKLFVSHQIGATYDEYGVLRFTDLSSVINRYTGDKFYPNFAVTDVPLTIKTSTGSITYESNLMHDSYNPTINPKIGKLIVQYTIPNQHTSINQSGDIQTVEKTVYQENTNLALASTWTKTTVNARDNFFSLGNSISYEGGPNTINGYSGYGFLGGELISWKGLQYSFSSTTLDNKDGQQINKVLFSADELQKTLNDILSSNTAIQQIYHKFNGKVLGVSRGEKFTSIRNHYAYHNSEEASSIPGTVSPYDDSLSQYFSLKTITATGAGGASTLSRNDTINKIVFESNVAKFVIAKNKTGKNNAAVLVAESGNVNKGEPQVPSAASNFNYFSTVFVASNYEKRNFASTNSELAEIGIYIAHSQAPLLIGLRNNKNKTYLVNNSISTATIKKTPTPNVFDGHQHRLTVAIRGGKAFVWVDRTFIGSLVINQNVNKRNFDMANATKWGVYADNLSVANNAGPVTFFVSEVYAVSDTRSFPYIDDGLGLDPTSKVNYHWQCSNFLRLLLTNAPDAEPKYYFWGAGMLKGGGGAAITGAHFYENQEMNTGPAQPGSLVNIYAGYDPGDVQGEKKTLTKVLPSDISMSPIMATPFRFSSAYVNNSNQLAFLSSSDNKINNGSIANIQIAGMTYSLSDAITIEKVINPANISNVTTLTTDWLQSTEDAENLINTAAKLINSFNTEVEVDIFGNPLIQVGDICQFVFTLKKIGYDPENGGVIPKYFFVKQVRQDFTGGLKTSLSLRPMFDIKYTSIP